MFDDYMIPNVKAPEHRYRVSIKRAVMTDSFYEIFNKWYKAKFECEMPRDAVDYFWCNSPLYDPRKSGTQEQ